MADERCRYIHELTGRQCTMRSGHIGWHSYRVKTLTNWRPKPTQETDPE